MAMFGTVGTGIAAAVLIVLGILILTRPLRFVFKLALHIFCGFAALVILNAVGAGVGVVIGVNWLNAAVAGILGLPGAALLLILKWLMLI
jgi:inhibitor of the pro-sigma K processing machinery